jgi:hypothetical protein
MLSADVSGAHRHERAGRRLTIACGSGAIRSPTLVQRAGNGLRWTQPAARLGDSLRGRASLMTRFALTLEFDGGPFMGLQRQSHGPSVQQAVEEAVQAVTGEACHAPRRGPHRCRGPCAGDARACRRRQADRAVPLMEALNASSAAPAPVAVLACEVVPDDWHARFSCIGRAISTASSTAARR